MTKDWAKLVADLERLLKLRNPPFGMKLFERAEDMEAIPRIRRPKVVHAFDQVVAQAARLGWTVGVTAENLVGAQCRAVIGLGNAKDDEWKSGQRMVGVWYSTPDDAGAHQAAMNCVDDGKYEAMVVSPLASGRLDPPDIALFYATPGAMMYFINGLQWSGYKRFDWSVVGESACADSWGRALKTRHAQFVDPVLCRAALWRRAGRRNADGVAAGPTVAGDHRHGGAVEERPALSVPAIRHPAGCARRDGRQLRRSQAAGLIFVGQDRAARRDAGRRPNPCRRACRRGRSGCAHIRRPSCSGSV